MIRYSSLVYFFLASAVIGGGLSYYKLYFFHVMLVLLFFGFISVKIRGYKIKIRRLPTNLHHFFYFMLIWYLLTFLWSIDVEVSILYIVYILFGLCIVITLVYFNNDINTQKKIVKVLAYVFIFEIIVSLLEAFTSFRWPTSPLSSYASYFGKHITDFSELADKDLVSYILGSPTGFFGNPNNLAVAMLMLVPFFLLHTNFKIRLLGAFSIIVIIIMAGSRGVFIGLSLMFVLYFIFINKKRALKTFLSLPLIIFLFSLLFFIDLSSVPYLGDTLSAFTALNSFLFSDNLDSGSLSHRREFIVNAINALQMTNYMGVGAGNSITINKGASMHNFWFELFVDAGILFILTLFVWYFYVLYKLWIIGINTKNTDIKYYSHSLFLAMTTFLISAISASSAIYLLPMWIMFGLAISTINIYTKEKYENFNIVRS